LARKAQSREIASEWGLCGKDLRSVRAADHGAKQALSLGLDIRGVAGRAYIRRPARSHG